MKMFLSISLVLIVLALVSLVVTWTVKCTLEWLDDIAFWWEEFKERHTHK